MLNIMIEPASLFLGTKRKIKEQYYSSSIESVLLILGIIFFTAWYGLVGLIIALILVRWSSSLLNLFFYHFPLTPDPTEKL